MRKRIHCGVVDVCVREKENSLKWANNVKEARSKSEI